MSELIFLAIGFLLGMWAVKILYSYPVRKKPPEIVEYPHKEEVNPAINRLADDFGEYHTEDEDADECDD